MQKAISSAATGVMGCRMIDGLFVELICKKKRDIVQNEHFEWDKIFLDFNARSARTSHLNL